MRRRRNRWLWTLAILLVMALAGFAFYRYWTRPVPLTAAVLADAVEDGKVLTAFARVFGSARSGATLRVTQHATPADVVKTFMDRRADIAILRADADTRGQANVLAVMRRNVGVLVSLDPRIDAVGKLRGRRIGVIGQSGADAFADALLRAYEIEPREVTLVPLQLDGVTRAAEDKRVDAVIGATPFVLRRQGEALRALLRNKKLKASILTIDRAEEVVRHAPAFEALEIPANLFGDLPEEPEKSVGIATNLVVQANMANEVAAALARQFLSNRQAVIAEAPTAAQISAPATAKDSFVRVHPGVAAYIDNEEETFFDKYGDLVYIFMAIGGIFGSGFVALRRSFGPDREADACELVDDLVDLRREARDLAVAGEAPGAPERWADLSSRFETMLATALPLIADSSVGDRTVQALSTALATTERAIADVAPVALARRPGSG
ncbi:MAG: ABC transporter substrate-binding protein [Methylobacteriaceae bacterium]|nr:ABC transporter substrate-binding protein [Methylobacteriaceae bacterium]